MAPLAPVSVPAVVVDLIVMILAPVIIKLLQSPAIALAFQNALANRAEIGKPNADLQKELDFMPGIDRM